VSEGTAVNRQAPRGIRAKVRPRPVPAGEAIPTMAVPDVGPIPAGWRVIAAKEFAEHLLSVRFLLLIVIMSVTGVFLIYTLANNIRDVAGAIPRAWNGQAYPVFLALFTQSPATGNTQLASIPSFAAIFTQYLGPLLGLAFGFDAISNERSEGTLPRLVAQPIHRDDVINGKFLASLSVVAMMLGALTLILAGIGIYQLGLIPDAETALRLVSWYVLAVLYVGFWLALAMLCSIVFRRGATAVLVVLAIWLVLTFFGGQIASLIGQYAAPYGANGTQDQQLANLNAQLTIQGLLPSGMFGNLTAVLLNPAVNSLNLALPDPTGRAVASLLPLDQSVLLVWPYVVALIAMTVAIFVVAYVIFMRQEVRA